MKSFCSSLTGISIYNQIGPGERIALSKLAVENYERKNRPLRIAIDISIWHFQIQSGRGGQNPALRTLYYRLLRLLSLGIQPHFVFDGPNRPPFKRNVKISPHATSLSDCISKQLFKLFDFPYHTAPGEAEAECALLQKEGVVDAVLSEDVDTLMFGSRVTLRNWSSEGPRGRKSPTHVNLYSAEATKAGASGLDGDGMILVALMSGGDYIPAGIPRCGIRVACQAARAGFGQDLCQIFRKDAKDKVSLRQWRERLEYELNSNESEFFRVKHKNLKIPEAFPDMAVVGYYIHPQVSSADRVLQLSSEIKWNSVVDVPGLRNFVIEAFGWDYMSGAKIFVRGLAPALLVHRTLQKKQEYSENQDELEILEKDEKPLITSICGSRTHFSTDGILELRVLYTPVDVVGIDLDLEKEGGLAINIESSSETEPGFEQTQTQFNTLTKQRASPTYDPTLPERLWMPETYVKLGVPSMVESWEETMQTPKKPKPSPKKPTAKAPSPRKPMRRAKVPPSNSQQGTIDSFMRISKPGRRAPAKNLPTSSPREDPSSQMAEKQASEYSRRVGENRPSSSLSESPTSQPPPRNPSKKTENRPTPIPQNTPPRHQTPEKKRTPKRSTKGIDQYLISSPHKPPGLVTKMHKNRRNPGAKASPQPTTSRASESPSPSPSPIHPPPPHFPHSPRQKPTKPHNPLPSSSSSPPLTQPHNNPGTKPRHNNPRANPFSKKPSTTTDAPAAAAAATTTEPNHGPNPSALPETFSSRRPRFADPSVYLRLLSRQ